MPIPPNEYHPLARQRKRPDKALVVAAIAALALTLALGFAAICYYSSLTSSLGGTGANSELTAVGNALDNASTASASAGCPPFDSAYPYPTPYDGEGYATTNEQCFLSVSAHPLSTFSADVDTASYANLRRMVREGATPYDLPAGAVRIEEMLNYFDYDYAPPTGDDLFGVTTQMADCPWNPDTKLLVMGFATTPAESAPAAGSNLVFLVDVSGSMADRDKLPLLQGAFATLVENLSENDRVSLVTYSGEERVVLEGASGADKQRILSALGSLRAEGSTNGEAGLRTAYDVAARHFVEGGMNRIVMASDGDLNVGMTSEDELHAFVDERRASGVYLSVLGFGTGNYQDAKMETLADHGNGSYHYIDCAAEARRVLDRNLLANFTPLADDVKLQVEFNPEQVKGYRLIGYGNRALADEAYHDDAADAGEVGAGHAFTVAYEVVPVDSPLDVTAPQFKYGKADRSATEAGGAEASSSGAPVESAGGDLAICTDGSEWLTCSMRYRPAGQDGVQEQAHVVDASTLVAAPSSDWKFAAAVIECGLVLSQSSSQGTASLSSALALMDDTESPEREEFANLMTTLAHYLPDPNAFPEERGRWLHDYVPTP